MELIERARHTLETTPNAALATVSAAGMPWNTTIYVAYDEALTFFWSSHTDAIHSRNIAANPAVFLLVFDSRLDDHSGQAVYISGEAVELQGEEAIRRASNCLAARRHESAKPAADFMGSCPSRLYALVPHLIWTNLVKEQNGEVFDERVAIDLDQLT